MKQSIFEVKANTKIAENTYKMVLGGDCSGITASGQFVNIKLDGFFLRRPISVCDYNDNELTLIYKVVGKGTEYMAELGAGEKLDILTGLGNGYDLSKSDVYKDVESDDYVLKDGDAVDGIAYVIETYGLIYNKALLNKYFELPDASIKSIDELNNFQALKTAAEEIQAHKDDLGVEGAFTSAGMDSSSDWRFKTHLANLPIYYEYKADGIDTTDAIKGTYLDNYKQIWDLYLNNSTCEPSMISSKTGDDAASEFSLGEAVFYQNGTWAYNDIKDNEVADEDMGMLPIYIGVDGEENQGLCTGSENYWCVNKNASEEDIQATLDFMKWVVESDEGRDMLANEMGFVTPFTTFADYLPDNPLVKANAEYTEAGKTPVSWNFTTMPSENWKNNVGGALLNYAQGTGAWDSVQTAFVDGWAEEYAAANE